VNAFVNGRASSGGRFYRAISRWLRPAGTSGATAIALSATQPRYCLCWRWTVGPLRAVVSQFRCPRRYCQSLERTRGRACTSLSVLAAAGVLTAVPSARLTVLTVLRAGQIDTGGTGAEPARGAICTLTDEDPRPKNESPQSPYGEFLDGCRGVGFEPTHQVKR